MRSFRIGLPAALLALVVVIPSPISAAVPRGLLVDVTEAGDLDGDGSPDLVASWSYEEGSGPTYVSETTLQARSGADGLELWTRTFSEGIPWASWVGGVVPARVGAQGVPGVLVELTRSVEVGHLGFGNEHHIVALDGAGQIVWRRDMGVAQVVTQSEDGMIVAAGNLLPGAATEVVVMRTGEGTFGNLVTLAGHTGVLELLDGTGTVRSSLTMPDPYDFIFGEVIPDVSGDGLPDLTGYGDAGIEVRRGSDLGLLWVAGAAQLVPIGDVTGDGRQDLVGKVSPDRGVLFDGATGSEIWNRPLGVPHPLGDIDGDGRPDIVGSTQTSEEGVLRVRYRAVTTDGDPIYEAEYSAPRPDGTSAYAGQQAARDVDGDGVDDLFQTLDVEGASQTGMVSGRTGEILWLAADHGLSRDADPIGGSLDGDGADVVEIVADGSQRTLVAADGADASVLWTTAVPQYSSVLSSPDLTGDGAPEVIVTVNLQSFQVRDGATGALLWAVA